MPRGVTGSNRLHLVAAILLTGLASVASAQQRPAPAKSDQRELTPEARHAVDRGIRWLADAQRDTSGSWPSKDPRYTMAMTALSGLALLAHGDTPETGRYAKNVRRTLKWIVKTQEEFAARHPKIAGLLFDRDPSAEDQPMHGHGFALLFLAEAYGCTADQVLRRRLKRAIQLGVKLTERSISRDGGWHYHPLDSRDEGSVTITQIQALRSAREAGIKVSAEVVKRAVDYIKKCQDPKTGGVRYTLRYGKVSPALTAAGVSVLHGAGEYYGEALELGYDYLRLNLDPTNAGQDWFFYTHLYGVQAMFQRGGPEWARYFPKIRENLLRKLAKTEGPYWTHPAYGKTYATSVSLLILQVPLRYLPIFQR